MVDQTVIAPTTHHSRLKRDRGGPETLICLHQPLQLLTTIALKATVKLQLTWVKSTHQAILQPQAIVEIKMSAEFISLTSTSHPMRVKMRLILTLGEM